MEEGGEGGAEGGGVSIGALGGPAHSGADCGGARFATRSSASGCSCICCDDDGVGCFRFAGGGGKIGGSEGGSSACGWWWCHFHNLRAWQTRNASARAQRARWAIALSALRCCFLVGAGEAPVLSPALFCLGILVGRESLWRSVHTMPAALNECMFNSLASAAAARMFLRAAALNVVHGAGFRHVRGVAASFLWESIKNAIDVFLSDAVF